MRVLCIGGGAGWSTKDVERGAIHGLRSAGVEVAEYALDTRIVSSKRFLDLQWHRAKRVNADVEKPTVADALLHAAQDALTKALLHQPEWVLLVSAMFVPRPFLAILQRAGLPVAVLMTESPYDTDDARELKWAEHADLVWTNERTSVSDFRQLQPRSFYLRHAWLPGVHDVEHEAFSDVPSHDVVFVGSCFQERVELLEAIDWTGIDVALYGNWKRLSRRSVLRQFVREGVVDNAKAAALYRKAKVGLNLYRESRGWGKDAPRVFTGESLSPRAYELAATGCFHVSHSRPEVSETFGDLVPTFKTASECEALIRYWLHDDKGRAEIGAQLPATVAMHTWEMRGRQMARELAEALPSAMARVANDVERRRRELAVAA